MTIYPIDQQIEELLASFIDEETGELTCTDEEMEQQIEALKMEFADVIKNLRNEVINRTAEADAIWGEMQNLDERKKRAKKAAERAKRFLAYLTKGEPYSDGIVKIGYRKSKGLIIQDKEQLLDWARQNAPGFLKDPELREGDIKTAIMRGQAIPFAYIEERNNIQVK